MDIFKEAKNKMKTLSTAKPLRGLILEPDIYQALNHGNVDVLRECYILSSFWYMLR